MLAPFRERGFVEAIRGPGGGWRMARPLDKITVGDVHEALPTASLLGIGLTRDHPGCPVERAIEAGLSTLLTDLEERTLRQLRELTLDSFANAACETETVSY